ncbi:DUF1415 domain-containing protein [Thalassomonas sp. M1454]|uniref:DUF1415 domain-containing protein n=1 Tax=Thalassomonas sp. M1454 TaxID=2594477 RepID=UPI00117FB1E4|nr:DUF1415 domain-containing protein [Thalassomonas sp. M1454]TRX56970.1 DUF1415 domain-containing protein [Thalassomonas sp. M1454]
MFTDERVIDQCKQWLDEIIIGLNFCPFAKKEFVNRTIAYPVLRNVDIESALHGLIQECEHLTKHPEISTSLIIFPEEFSFFDDYLDLVAMGEQLLIDQGYEGIYQIATFHPDYYFADVAEDDVSNYTNRSPFPILHLLREDSLAKAIKAHPDPEGIPDKNIEVCDHKGIEFFQQFLVSLRS